jgi:molecular chaperone DnaK (HSP70)
MSNDLTIVTKNNNSLDKAKLLLESANKLTINKLLGDSRNLILKDQITYIGVDFGTSTTVVSIATGDPKLGNLTSKAIELNQKLYDGGIYKNYKIPTMVGWYNSTLLVGQGANDFKQKLKQGKNLWHSFKMELGEDSGAKYAESELNNDKIRILNPKDVTTLFFKYLKTQIEKYVKENNLPSTIEYAVSIPASFEANQRKDLIDSLHANEMMLKKQALIDEPNAAFLSYISNQNLQNEVHISEDFSTNILVFDFGAGTCDISILEIANTARGYQSKNLAISRFDALGGNDIDKKIALDILFQQFLNENNVDEDSFKTKEKDIILSRLEKAAELLKIKVSDELDLIKNNNDFEKIIKNNKVVQINQKIEIRTKKGTFVLEKPQLSYLEFIDIINSFTTSNIEDYENPNAKTVFTPIISALEKSNLHFEDIDYILFIGGSAKNPLIQKAIKEYFEDSVYLIPSDLQAHVSAGAAIHSLMYNGFGKNLIDPITSEQLLAMVKDNNSETLTTLLKAGTTIPCQNVIIDNLQVQRDNQNTIEIPIYIGSKDKLLHNIKIHSRNPNGFVTKDNIKIILSVNSDKMLLVKAIINNDEEINIEPLNPFSNKIAHIKDRKKFEIEKEFNLSKANNSGKEDLQSLKKLYHGYDRLCFYLEAAETLEELYEKYNYGSLNNIGVAYSNAGNEEKAMGYYLRDFEEHPSEVSAFNIANKYKYKNKIKYKEWLEKSLEVDENYNESLYSYGVYLVDNGDEEKGYKLINKAFNSWKSEYENDNLSSHLSWFISCAKYLEKYDFANKLEKENQKDKEDFSEFSSDNLTKMKS